MQNILHKKLILTTNKNQNIITPIEYYIYMVSYAIKREAGEIPTQLPLL